MHRSKGFKKNIEFNFIHFADAEAEAVWFSSPCDAVHQQGSSAHCSAQQASPGVTRAQELKHGSQGRNWPCSQALKMPALSNGFAFSSPKPLLGHRLKHTCPQTGGPPARGTGEGRHRACVMPEPSTSTAPAKGAARLSRWTPTQDTTLSWPRGYQSKW